jgi:tetratricopeptide (TPR) repeat protein
MDRAMELDPLKPLVVTLYGHILVFGGHLDEAISYYQDALRAAPDNPVSHSGLLRAFYKKGMHREALEQAGISYALQTGEEIAGSLQEAYEEHGPEEAWLLFAEALAEWTGPALFKPAQVAEIYDHAGQTELAISWLERAFEIRDPSLPALTTGRFSGAVRADPRFEDLQRRMNLPSS